MLRVVFDTVVFVRCLINPYGLWGRLVFDRTGRYELVVSPPVLQEILEVLARPSIQRKYRTIAGRGIEHLLEIVAHAEVVAIAAIPAVARDPKDDKFLATAIAAHASYVVSEDEDLLSIGEYERIRIVTAARFLRLLESPDQNAPNDPT